MAMTSCKECASPVADQAPTCPSCGVESPGDGSAERDAAHKASSSKQARLVGLGCGGTVLAVLLLIGAGAAWNALTDVELDDAARTACSGVTAAQFGDGEVRRAAGTLQAVAAAKESNAEGLREAVGDGPVDPATLSEDYIAVSNWCAEHAS